MWSISIPIQRIKSPRPLRTALDSECLLITDKQTGILGCIPCVMVMISAVRALTDGRTDIRTDIRTDRQTDGRTNATKRIISLASRSIITCQSVGLLTPFGARKSPEPSTAFLLDGDVWNNSCDKMCLVILFYTCITNIPYKTGYPKGFRS